jgi:NitT/TauT family transport system substrate-binding protein
MDENRKQWSRRKFIEGLGLAGAWGWLGLHPVPAQAEAPPETGRIRIAKTGAICMAPHFVAEDLLRGEGFDEVAYVDRPSLDATEKALAAGEADINVNYALRLAVRLDAGDPLVVLAGIHVGCIELLVHEDIRSIGQLKGRRLAAGRVASGVPQLAGVVLGQLGLSVPGDVEVVARPAPEAIALFVDGKVDAFIGIPPEPQEIRARGPSRVLLDTSRDRPWSQYFCCMVSANREFVRRHPVAAKRAVRALLKAADLCGAEPEQAARLLVERGHTPSYDYARDALRGIPYRAWREFDPEEALRFYALRLREAGVITASPKKLIAEGTDWEILRALRRELKA